MDSLTTTINSALTAIFNLLLLPFEKLDPWWGLVIVSLVAGVVLVKLYGWVSNQRRIRELKRNISANLLESILFRHDLKVSLTAQARMLKYGGLYFLAAIPPLLILIVPCIFVLAQLNLRYNHRTLDVGEDAIFKVVAKDSNHINTLALEHSAGIEVTPPVRIGDTGEVWWRVSGLNAGKHSVTIIDGDTRVERPVFVNISAPKIAGALYANPIMKLLYPADIDLSSRGPFELVELRYPERDFTLFGISMHWIIVFFLLSLASGLAAAKVMKIEV